MAQLIESCCDLLIIGAGPAGYVNCMILERDEKQADTERSLMAATWAARCGIHARILDKRGTKIFTGQVR